MAENVRRLPLLPLRNTVVFPGCVGTVQVTRRRNIALLRELDENKGEIVLLPLRDPRPEEPNEKDMAHVGAVARAIVVQPSQDNSFCVTFEASTRQRLVKLLAKDPFYLGEFAGVALDNAPGKAEGLAGYIYSYTLNVLDSAAHYSPEVKQIIQANRADLPRLVDIISHHLHFPFEAKRELLIAETLEERIQLLFEYLSEACRRLDLEQELKVKVDESLVKAERELYLRTKLKEIRRELGEAEEDYDLAVSYRGRIEMVKGLPLEVKERLFFETERLKRLSPASAEFSSIKRYLDWLLSVPWNRVDGEEQSVSKIEKIINANFYGARSVKDRIIEYLTTRLLAHNVLSPALCLSGPPGTGKAALASTIAEALGRKLVRFSVAGMIVSEEVKGEARTIQGAMPGRIVRSLVEVDCINPVIFIEDLDRLAMDETRMSATLAFLEVIDPRQNRKFIDDYINLPVDLSQVVFILSVRGTEPIPEALIERMEVVEFAGYIDREKVAIAEKFLIPSILKSSGIQKTELSFSAGAVKNLISNYTMEAGLGQMKARIETICRKFSRAKATTNDKMSWEITEDNLEEHLGAPLFIPETGESRPEVGVAAGVAWTGSGGDIMMIEGLKMVGSGSVTSTGSLGDVMRESVQAAHSYVRSKADLLGIAHADFSNYDIHIHFPQGAIPKDGPSAGVTISLVIASVMSDRPIRNDIAMTGEVSLRGKVLPVSGVKEKIAAAHRAGIYKFILPTQNKKDLKEISKELKDQMEFIYVDRIDQVFELALLDYKPGAETLRDLIGMELRRRTTARRAAKKRVAEGKNSLSAKKTQAKTKRRPR